MNIKKLTTLLMLLLAVQKVMSINYDNLSDQEIRKKFENSDFDQRMELLASSDGKASKKLGQISLDPTLWKNYSYRNTYQIDFSEKDKSKMFILEKLEILLSVDGKQKTIVISPTSSTGKSQLEILKATNIQGDKVCDLSASLEDRSPNNPKPYRAWHYTQFLMLCDLLKNNKDFTVLDLTNDNVSQQSLVGTQKDVAGQGILRPALSKLLQKNKTIKTLIMKNISFNPFKPNGEFNGTRGDVTNLAPIFSKILAENNSLIKLDLSNINLGSEGAKKITEGLSNNTTLKVFDLSGNNIEKKVQDDLKKKFPRVNFIF